MNWRQSLVLTTAVVCIAPALSLAQTANKPGDTKCPVTIQPTTTPEGKPAPVAGGTAFFPPPCEIEGQPIETRPVEGGRDQATFPGQTRAPYHASKHGFKVTTITDKLDLPWALQFLPDGKFLVTEKTGAIRIVSPDGTVSDPIKNVPDSSYAGDAGMLDVALDPHFADNHTIYFNYIRPVGQNTRMALTKATLDEANLSLSNVEVIFMANEIKPKLPSNNQNGRMVFAKDGTIFLSLGARTGMSVQDPMSDLGKIVHITTDGRPVKTNPFYTKEGHLPEIYATGFRTPEGMAIDAKGQLWENEHGPRGGDKLDLIKPAANYGWPLVTHGWNYPGEYFYGGLATLPWVTEPRYYWDPVIGPSCLTFYYGKMFPEWNGNAFVCELRGKSIARLTIDKNNKITSEEPLLVDMHTQMRDLRVAPDGSIYVLTNEAKNGKLLHLTAN